MRISNRHAAGILLGCVSPPLFACCVWNDGFEGTGELAAVAVSPSEVVVGQDDSAPVSLTFGCGTAVGPIEVQVAAERPGISVLQTGLGDCGSPATVSVLTSGSTPPGTHAVDLKARPRGGQWFVKPMWLQVDSGARFAGEFTSLNGFSHINTWGYSATGDRCEWWVSWEGTIEIEFTDTTPHYVDWPETNSFTFTGTRRSHPKEEIVGTTTCVSTTKHFTTTRMFKSLWPQIEILLRFQTASTPTVGYDVLVFHGNYQPNWREFVGFFEFFYDRPDAGGEGSIGSVSIPRID